MGNKISCCHFSNDNKIIKIDAEEISISKLRNSSPKVSKRDSFKFESLEILDKFSYEIIDSDNNSTQQIKVMENYSKEEITFNKNSSNSVKQLSSFRNKSKTKNNSSIFKETFSKKKATIDKNYKAQLFDNKDIKFCKTELLEMSEKKDDDDEESVLISKKKFDFSFSPELFIRIKKGKIFNFYSEGEVIGQGFFFWIIFFFFFITSLFYFLFVNRRVWESIYCSS